MKNEWIFPAPVTVTQPTLPDFTDYVNTIKPIWDAKWLTNDGPLHEKFRNQLRDFLMVDHLQLCTNGHLALEIAIKALNIEGEVITTPFTFASTVHAITNCGLTPVFCDVDPKTYNIDPSQIEKYITEKTSAIVAVHVFGTPCDVEAIETIAKKHHLKVIYDAAHAFGVELNGKGIGTYGDVSMFSMHATKVFHSIEGGILTFSDSHLEDKIRSLKNFGITSVEDVGYVGTNAKMNEFQAAMGLCNLELIEEAIAKRQSIHETYVSQLDKIDSITVLPTIENTKANYSYFPILLKSNEQRDQLHEILKNYRVMTRKYFYPLCNDFSCYGTSSIDTPVARGISSRVLCLPMYTGLQLHDVEQICSIIEYEVGEMI